MVCDDVKRVAYFFLDGQLGQEREQAFSYHLKNCRGCDDLVAIHRRLRAFFRRRLKLDLAPLSLRERLQGTLATARTQSEAI
jgi:mycothiol system anti-sigma-R factor